MSMFVAEILLTGLVDRLANPTATGRTEADIQSDIKALLLTADLGLDEPLLEEPINHRRIDIRVGATVIEVKRELTGNPKHVQQLHDYVVDKQHQTDSRYNGILTDGKHWWLYETDPATGEFNQITSYTLGSTTPHRDLTGWLQAVLATPNQIKPEPQIIEEFLGSNSTAYKQDAKYLAGLYEQTKSDPTVQLKRDLWARLLRTALGTSFEDIDSLFLNHTLLVIEASAIGHAVMGIELTKLLENPEQLLTGQLFRDYAIHNVIESDFFDWILATDGARKFLRRVVQRVNQFDWSNTEHDVLKILYESVIRADDRKGLGEYYTPDWLAEGIVQKTVTEPLTQRVLDPACGSGTFLFHTVRHLVAAGKNAGWDGPKTVRHVTDHVFGMDIHPVSVALARITYLLALGELLQDRDAIWVPVHLGDAMQWHQPVDHDENMVRIRTTGEDIAVAETEAATLFEIADTLIFPLNSVSDPGDFDRLVTDLTTMAKKYVDPTATKPPIATVLRKFAITNSEDQQILTETFNLLCDLNATGRDSIWGYYVRNQVRPVWLSMPGRRVDVLVGNPPWVAYRFMTPELQKRFKRLSQDRNLWHGAKIATHQDLVGLFIVRAAEKYLNHEGHFGFVTPLATLSRQQYEGLRAGEWGSTVRGEFTEVWDLEKIRASDFFPVPSAVMFGIKRDRSNFGANVASGMPATKKVATGLRNKDGWEATNQQLTWESIPILEMSRDDEPASPYHGSATQGATITPRVLFFIEEQDAHSRLGQRRGHTSFRSRRNNLEKPPWKNLPDLTGVIEDRFIYDIHLGETIVPFRDLEPLRAILPVDNDEIIDPKAISAYSPGAAKWWEQASTLWEANKTKQSKLDLVESLDYQSKLTKQLPAPRHRVVYAKSGNRLAACVLTNPKAVIDHKLYWLPTRNLDEARYLTAVLNAPETTKAVAEYQSRGLFGARDFDTYVWRLPVGMYDANNPVHAELVELAKQSEGLAQSLDLDGVRFQKARQRVRTALADAGISDQLDKLVSKMLGR